MSQHLNRRALLKQLGASAAASWVVSERPAPGQTVTPEANPKLRIGMIGLDTSHVTIFTKMLNMSEQPDARFAGCRVVAAFPAGNPQFPLSRDRIEGFTNGVKALGVKIVSSIEELLPLVDAVMLESVDGSQHLEQVQPVFAAGKPVFIDKPLAASFADVQAIAELGTKHKTPWFSASSSRFTQGYPELKKSAEIGDILGVDTFSQARAAPGHPDLFWYGVHGVDLLYSLMGTGCRSVTAMQSPLTEQVTGAWENGRVGTYRAIREHTGKTGLGATVFGSRGITHVNNYYDYVPLLATIVEFFRTKTTPIPVDEMVEVFAYLEAAEESKRRGGVPVLLDEVRNKRAQ